MKRSKINNNFFQNLIIDSGLIVIIYFVLVQFTNIPVFINMIIALAIAGVVSFYIAKEMSKPFAEFAQLCSAISKGEDVTLSVKTTNVLGEMAASFNSVAEKLKIQEGYLENLPTPVLIIDKEFNLVYINKVGQELVDKNLSECQQYKCYELMHADHCQSNNCRLHQAMNDGQIHGSEQVARPNGKELDIMYTGTPVVNKNGELLGAIEFVADISKDKEAERYLNRSTNTIMEAMQKFSQGDLTVQVKPEKTDDAITKLFLAFNDTIAKIKQIILHITDAVDATASASTQISSSAEEMAAGAQEQSSQTAEVATAMEEMTSTIVETNKNTNLAAEAAKDSGTIAQEGGKAVEATISGMGKIAEVVIGAADTVKKLGANSEKIGDIINVINDIADQTNLLALNAAIEAARAGEQGRGFAVVADEVRKLAERTTSATKEIAGMIKQLQTGTTETVTSIEQGVEEVEKGKELAENAGKSMIEIEESSEKIMDIITQVATASEQQSATAEEVSKNIEGINMVAQESAAGVEQIAKASEDLNRLTENLQQLVNQFKVNGDNSQQCLVNGDGKISKGSEDRLLN